MKIRFIMLFIAVISLCCLTSCNQPAKLEVYSFNGENDFFYLNNGIIVITDDLEVFSAGDLIFKEEQQRMKSRSAKIYFYKDGVEQIIFHEARNADTEADDLHDANMFSTVGSHTRGNIFNDEEWDLIKNEMRFELLGTYINGESFEYDILLNLSENLNAFADD